MWNVIFYVNATFQERFIKLWSYNDLPDVILQVFQLAQFQLPSQVGDFTEEHVSLCGHLLQLRPQADHLVGEIHRRHFDDYR